MTAAGPAGEISLGPERPADWLRLSWPRLARALHAAVANQVTLDSGVERTLLDAALRGRRTEEPRGPWPDGLTAREGEILMLIASDLSNREIAGRLFIGNATVKTHINRIFAKIGVTHRAAAIAYARRLRQHRNSSARP